ncbi:MAG: restriction endonuclease [Candidatus Sumerlaeota bacterium]|nr:restriction endonuclease [Candidatus Sumerlaeota bacterium]
MPSRHQYINCISKFDFGHLQALWQRILKRQTKADGWKSGKALEYFILRAFQESGAEVQWPYSVSSEKEEIEQIDGVIYTDGLTCLIECKDEKSEINFEPIAKMRSQLMRRPSGAIGAIFSMSGFTYPAKMLADYTSPQTILLWSKAEIDYAFLNRRLCDGLMAKYRHCIEYGIADFVIRKDALT